MKTMLTLDDDLLTVARELTGLTDLSALVHAGLNALIAHESGRQLAAAGESQPRLKPDRPRRLRSPR